MPSHYEPFGRTAIEAMACGTPVIAWNVGGLPEVITHGYDGYLCDAFDIRSTAKYIMELVNNSKLRSEISKTAITTATCKYGAKKYSRDLEILFKKVTKNREFNHFD
jgi:glycosyltransferase involved in cell wall biosynthesis